MPWVAFDDQFNNHPKVIAAGPLAQLLHMKAIVYCGQYLTDGFVPTEAIDLLVNWGEGQAVFVGDANFLENAQSRIKQIGNQELISSLVDAGLWHETDGGFRIHDYLDWNPSGKETKRKRAKVIEARRKAGKKGGRPRKAKDNQTETKSGTEKSPDPDPDPEPLYRSSDNGDGEIRSTADLEKAISSWGWGFTLTEEERGKCHRIVTAGAIQGHEVESARKKAAGKGRPPSYFLGCVERSRAAYAKESSGPSPPARPRRETDWERIEREFVNGAPE